MAETMIEDKFAKAFYNNQTGMAITILGSGVYIDVNDKYASTMGYKREEMIGKSILELNIWADVQDRNQLYEHLTSNGQVQDTEYRYRKKTGEIGYAISSLSCIDIDGESHLLTSLIDITQRKKIEDDLHIAQEKFSKSFYESGTMEAIFRLKDGIFIEVNDSYANNLGFTREDMIGKSAMDLGIWADLRERREINEQLNKFGYIKDKGHSFMTKSGDIGYAVSNINLLNINGEPYILVSSNNITKMKHFEHALQQSEKLLLKIFNSIPLPIIIVDREDHIILEVNETLLERSNLKREDVIGTRDFIYNIWYNPDDLNKYQNCFKQNGKAENFETKFKLPTGETIEALLSGVVVKWKDRECILTLSNNISELRKYQREISKLDNFNLMGQMAASIAHEVRNPMTSIKGFLQLFENQEKYKDDKDAMDLMVEEIDRVNEIITTFLSLAQKNALELRRHSLNDSIRKLKPLIMADSLKNDIYLKTELGNIPRANVDEGEIKQLLLNLVRNAIQAMPSGGILTIKTFQDINGINLVVKDKGHGIPEEIIDKIGTPFLTTKKNGSGLGLAVCYSIAERHNARISYKTTHQGTSFKVTFPVIV